MKKYIIALTLLLTFLLSGCGETADPSPFPQESPSSLPSNARLSPSPTEQLALPPESPAPIPPLSPSPLPGEEPIVWENTFFGLFIVSGMLEQTIPSNQVHTVKVYPSQLEAVRSLEIYWNDGNFHVMIDGRGGGMYGTPVESVFDFNEQRVISNIKDLRYFPELESLTLINTDIFSLEPISELSNLKNLYITGNYHTGRCARFTDLSPLVKLKSLEKLTVFNKAVNTTSALKEMPQLRELSLEIDPYADIIPIYSLKALTSLDLYDMYLDTLDFQTACPELERLRLIDCNIDVSLQ